MTKPVLLGLTGWLIGKLLEEFDVADKIGSKIFHCIEVNQKENPPLFCALKMWIHTSIDNLDSVAKRRKESFSGQDIYLPSDSSWHRLTEEDPTYIAPSNAIHAYFDKSNSYKWTLWIKLIRDKDTELQTISLSTYKHDRKYIEQIPNIFKDAQEIFRGESVITFTVIQNQFEFRGREYGVKEPIFDDAIESEKEEIVRFCRKMKEVEGSLQNHPDLRSCYCIEGPPGTGKTSLAKWTAKTSGFDLYEIDITQTDLDDARLKKIVAGVPPFSVILFEHIAERLCDVKQSESNTERINNLTPSGFAESLEQTQPGTFTFLTTNNLDLLYTTIDEHILRKGRVEKTLKFTLPSKNQILRFLRHLSHKNENEEKRSEFAEKFCELGTHPKNMADIASYFKNTESQNVNDCLENVLQQT